MRKMLTLTAVLGFMTTFAAIDANALPFSSAPAATSTSDAVQLVAGGCGPGYHRGPYGGCRPNMGPPRGPRCFFRFGRRVCRF